MGRLLRPCASATATSISDCSLRAFELQAPPASSCSLWFSSRRKSSSLDDLELQNSSSDSLASSRSPRRQLSLATALASRLALSL